MIETIFDGYKKRTRHYYICIAIMIALLGILVVLNMTIGNPNYYVIKNLRLPRTLAAIFCGFAFGVAGHVFQTILGNPLASPDIIGVTSGASVAAVFGILILGANRSFSSIMALISGLIAAALIYAVAYNGSYSNSKLILTGIGANAFFSSLISWMLLIASEYDVSSAMRWLSGSLNGVTMTNVYPLLIAVSVTTIILLAVSQSLKILELGDAYATVLGVPVNVSRIVIIICAVCLIAFATSVSGPIASVAFLSGPIATRLLQKGHSNIVPAGLVGAIITIAADFLGNLILPTRYPVGVITGLLGAPYLLYLLISLNRGKRI